MSYYVLPKNNNIININPQLDNNNNNNNLIYTSYSVYNYYENAYDQLIKILSLDEDLYIHSISEYEKIYKEFNPYEYIFSKVPGSKYSVSKIKTQSNLFYEFLEIINILNCFDAYKNMNIRFMHIGKNYDDIAECFHLFRENNEDEIFFYNENITERCNFLFFENNETIDNLNLYILNLINIINIIIKFQSVNGTCVIQINHIIHKPIIELLYLLTSFFEKTYIIKPNSNNVISFDKYLICKNFILNEDKIEIYKKYYNQFHDFINNYKMNISNNIVSIINQEIPYYFINKIDDINIIIGQQQLECIDQIINVFKNNNKKDRIEYIRKINIQKAVNWCEKFKIPCNKFLEKTNIFLPVIKGDVNEVFNDVKDINDTNDTNDTNDKKYNNESML